MHKNKILYFAIIMLVITFICSAFVAPILAKYVSEKKATTDKDADFELDYQVSQIFEVRTQEELFAAINQGYSYVQLADDIENPLIITQQQTENLDADLILDLNGIEIQRSGHNPILNIGKGVRLTVTDTSAAQTGGLYNPVGSVLNINGGILTVVSGDFETGPRYSEYYTYNDSIAATAAVNANDTNKDNDNLDYTDVLGDAKEVNYFVKGTDNKFPQAGAIKNAPIIKSYPEPLPDRERPYEHGNLYFDVEVNNGDITIKADTYCYYHSSENKTSTAVPEDANWYYTYYVSKENYNYVGYSRNADTDIEITIYGYEGTISDASNKSELTEYYSAISMQSGTLEVQKGGFYSYWGVDKTAAVNAISGTLEVKNGNFSSRVPNASSNADGLEKKDKDTNAFVPNYFNQFAWSDEGKLASKGASYCILSPNDNNDATNATVEIGTGNLYSSNSNIISLAAGSLKISGGTFTKNEVNISRNEYGTNGSTSAINMQAGTLRVSDVVCTVTGNYSSAIHMADGELTVNSCNFNINGDNTYGIHSAVQGENKFNVNSSTFKLNKNGAQQNKQVGVYATGPVNFSGDTSIVIDGSYSYGIQVDGPQNDSKASVYLEQGEIKVDGASSYGIYAKNGTVTVNQSANVTMGGASSYGIYAINDIATANDSITINESATVIMGGASSCGIYAEKGSITIANSANVTLNGANNTFGISVNTGNIKLKQGTITASGTKACGIYAQNGSVTIQNSATVELDGAESCGIQVVGEPSTASQTGVTLQQSTITAQGANSYGIHAENGSVTIQNSATVELDGAESCGIYAEGGTVTANNTNIKLSSNQICYGVFAISNNTSAATTSINLTNSNIRVGLDKTTIKQNDSTTAASIGVYLQTAFKTVKDANGVITQADQINLTNANIYCYEVGIAMDGGALNITNSDSKTGTIQTNTASAIALYGGDLIFDENSNYTITSRNTRSDAQLNGTTTINSQYSNNAYTLSLPNSKTFTNTDGIYVNGGNFTSNGNINLTHTGLLNKYSSTTYNSTTYYYTGLDVTSYAVRVEGGSCTITQGTITAKTGGGVYCSKGTSEGAVTLGEKNNPNNKSITVNAEGTITTSNTYSAIGSDKWYVPLSINGGNAVESNGGSLNIYYGTYTAQYGNGILAQFSDRQTGTINVYDGEFNGNMNSSKVTIAADISGPGASFGIKLIGGGTMNVYGGTYNGRAGSICITGVNSFANTNNYYALGGNAKLYVYAGTFGGSTEATAPTDGLYVLDAAELIMGAGDSNYASRDAIKVYAKIVPISANHMGRKLSSKVEIYYGDYVSGRDSDWSQDSFASIVAHNCAINGFRPSINSSVYEDKTDTLTKITYNEAIYSAENDYKRLMDISFCNGTNLYKKDSYSTYINNRDNIIYYYSCNRCNQS